MPCTVVDRTTEHVVYKSVNVHPKTKAVDTKFFIEGLDGKLIDFPDPANSDSRISLFTTLTGARNAIGRKIEHKEPKGGYTKPFSAYAYCSGPAHARSAKK